MVRYQGKGCGKMKKLIMIIGMFCLLIIMTGCNYQLIEFEYNFNKAVCNYDGDNFTLKIDKWTDYEGEQLQVISNGKTYLISANKCYLVEE